MKALLRRATVSFDRFLFESCDPLTGPILRIGFGSLLIIFVVVWMIDGTQWFSDQGVFSSTTSQLLVHIPNWSLLYFLPTSPFCIKLYLACMLVQSVLLLLGCWSRFQVACIFLWLVSFQHRNMLIGDGEDTVFRLFAFFLIFIPLDCAYSFSGWLRGTRKTAVTSCHAWAVRLIQVQMTLIYLSAAWSKLQGETWRDGTALYLVSRGTDLYGRFWVPDVLFETPWFVRLATWAVPAIEAALPLALWYKPARRWAIIVGIVFHLAIDYAMNLFLFQWIMMLGLLAFANPSGWASRSGRPSTET